MTHDPPSPLPLVIAELAAGGIIGHATQFLDVLPGWAGGILGALVVTVVGRLLAPTLDVHAARLRRVLAPGNTMQPPPPPSPDDRDASDGGGSQ